MRRTLPNRRGTASVAIIVLLVLLQIIVAGIVLSGARDQELSVQRLASARSYYAADSGMHMAVREVSLGVDVDADGAIGSISNNGSSADDPRIGGTPLVATAAAGGGGTLITILGSRERCGRRVQLLAQSSVPGVVAVQNWNEIEQ